MPEATPFQVMIVDDHPLMRRGVRQLLELDSGFEVVAEAGDGASAIDLANRLDIDVILLDLNMKGMSGLDTLNALRRDGVTAQIIILTVSDASSDVFALIDASAHAWRPPFCSCNNAGHNKNSPMASPSGHFLFTLLRRQMLHRLRDTTFDHRTASIVGR